MDVNDGTNLHWERWGTNADGDYRSSTDGGIVCRIAPAPPNCTTLNCTHSHRVVYELSYRFRPEGRWFVTDTRGTVTWCMRVAEIMRVRWKR